MAAQVPSNGLNIDAGLKFPATASMQSDGNTLDDYEAGYYTVSFAIADLTERADYACNALCFTIGSNNASTENGNWVVTVGGDGSVARLWRNSGTNVADDVGDDVDSSCVFMLAFNYTTSA